MKQKIKTLLIWLMSILRRDTSSKVVFYHDIGTKYTPMGTPETLFWLHMAYLQELKSRVEVEGNDHHSSTSTLNFDSHVVAFDDGFRGIWDARSRLKVEVDNGLKVIVFIAIDLVGKPGYLTWDEIRTLQNDYGFNFQCHTWSHQTLIGPVNTDLPPPDTPDFRTDAWYHHELIDSKNELERQLNLQPSTSNLQPRVIDALCFPVGYFSDDVIKRCAAAGYTNLYASFPGNLKGDTNSIVDLDLISRSDAACRIIPRCLCQSSSLLEFTSILNGGLNPFISRYIANHYLKEPFPWAN